MVPTRQPGICHRICLSLLLCLCIVEHLPGQELSFGTLSIEDGLSVYSVTEVFQDRKGLLWIGTVDGLNRYDGYNVKVYRHIPGDSTSLPNNYINANAIAEDDDGHLWIGTSGGLSRYNPFLDTFKNFTVDEGLTHNRVMGVVYVAGKVWVATLGGLDALDTKTGTFTHYRHNLEHTPSQQTDAVFSLDVDAKGQVWIGTSAGISKIDPVSGSARRIASTGSIWRMHVAPDGTVWAGGTKGKLHHISPESGAVRTHELFAGRSVPATAGYVIDIMHDDQGVMWVGTYDGGLFQFRDKIWQQYQHDPGVAASLPGNRVLALLQDRTGKYWVGTSQGLGFVQKTKAFDALDLQLPIPTSAKTILVSDDNVVWIGTENHGLIRKHGSKLTRFNTDNGALHANNVTTLLEDSKGNIWVGTSGGGISIIPPDGEIQHLQHNPQKADGLPSNQIYTLLEDREHRIWIGTVQAGLILYSPETGSFKSFLHDTGNPLSIGSNEVWTLYLDSNNQLWAGTIGGGLNRVELVTTPAGELSATFKRYVVDPDAVGSISSNNVVTLYEDSDGMLWLGTMGGGLVRFDPEEERFESWQSDRELTHNNVACVLPDSVGNLWLPTTFGLTRFNPSTGRFNRYTVEDGLNSSVFYLDGCATDNAGNFYMANLNGVATFAPGEITHNTTRPTAILSDVLLFNESLQMDSSAIYKHTLTLKHDENFLGFVMGSTDYVIPGKNQFRYKLDGIDQDWVTDRGARLANYAALAPGVYTFHLIAANNDGVWGDATQLMIEILAPLHQQPWFKALIAMGGLGLIGGFLWYRQLQQNRLEFTRQQIADDLHDDITGNLGALRFFLGRLKKAKSLEEADQESAGIYLALVQRMMGDLRDVVWLADPGADTLGVLIERLLDAGKKLTQGHAFTFSAEELPHDKRLKMNLRRHLYLMSKEALHNAVRHAEADNIAVVVTLQAKQLRIIISDDGKGYNPENVKAGQGMRSIQRRLDQSSVSMTVDTAEGQGTSISFMAEMT